MLIKLLKYEFKSTYLKFLSGFAVYVIMAAILLIFFRDNIALTISLVTIGLIALWVMMLINIFQRYNGNLYGGEGYLMFSLPVSSRKLLLSKIISTCVWIIGLGVLSVAAVFIVACVYGNIPSMNKFFTEVFSHILQVIPYLVQMGSPIIFSIISIYLAITVSKLPLWRKFGVLMGIITYFVANTIRSLPSTFMGETGTSFSTNNNVLIFSPITNTDVTKIWIQSGFDVLLCVGIFFLISFLMEKKTNLN